MIILGIETSCDETAVAVVKGKNGSVNVLSSVISSQIKLHADWGGIVPNLAAREHLKNIMPVIELSLKGADLDPEKIDLIAITRGPGLIPALLIGTSVAKTLSWVWKKPLLGINHIEGHIYSNFVREGKRQKAKGKNDGIKFPILCLVVSGGHTQLILMKNHLNYKIIGETLDDAAGEAFDKVARILGLGYPGGPIISAYAEMKLKLKSEKLKVNFPRPMINSKDFNFSFSGLKTAVLYEVKKLKTVNQEQKITICREFQQAVIDVLISKTLGAAKKFRPKTIMLAGGVSANVELRRQLGKTIRKIAPSIGYRPPAAKYSVDNAVMIAAAAGFRWQFMDAKEKEGAFHNWKKIETDANLRLR
jgi:N6-L-threonylcarbamoyladenine synthase